jgi:hypothetical protein
VLSVESLPVEIWILNMDYFPIRILDKTIGYESNTTILVFSMPDLARSLEAVYLARCGSGSSDHGNHTNLDSFLLQAPNSIYLKNLFFISGAFGA